MSLFARMGREVKPLPPSPGISQAQYAELRDRLVRIETRLCKLMAAQGVAVPAPRPPVEPKDTPQPGREAA